MGNDSIFKLSRNDAKGKRGEADRIPNLLFFIY